MDGARDELLPGAGFAGDQHGRFSSRDLGHARQYFLYRWRGADDFLKHRNLLDLLAENQILPQSAVLASLAVVDVDPRAAPADDPLLFVPQRVDMVKKPTILAVVPTHAGFHGEGCSV